MNRHLSSQYGQPIKFKKRSSKKTGPRMNHPFMSIYTNKTKNLDETLSTGQSSYQVKKKNYSKGITLTQNNQTHKNGGNILDTVQFEKSEEKRSNLRTQRPYSISNDLNRKTPKSHNHMKSWGIPRGDCQAKSSRIAPQYFSNYQSNNKQRTPKTLLSMPKINFSDFSGSTHILVPQPRTPKTLSQRPISSPYKQANKIEMNVQKQSNKLKGSLIDQLQRLVEEEQLQKKIIRNHSKAAYVFYHREYAQENPRTSKKMGKF